jgi:hypothetical protein
MLRAAVVLALVAVALAQNSPYTDSNIASPLFSNSGDQVRFVPRLGHVLAVSAPEANGLEINNAVPYRIVSVGGAAENPQNAAPVRTYFGNVGRERFQNIHGQGQAPAGNLALSLDPMGRDRVVRDSRLQSNQRTVTTSPFLAVPTFTRKIRSLPLNANDIVLAREATPLSIATGYSWMDNSPSTVRYFVVDQVDVVGIYSAGLRLHGDNYASNIAGSKWGGF